MWREGQGNRGKAVDPQGWGRGHGNSNSSHGAGASHAVPRSLPASRRWRALGGCARSRLSFGRSSWVSLPLRLGVPGSREETSPFGGGPQGLECSGANQQPQNGVG